ncbi:MAG: DUF2892 domain-containing protein [Oscillospiraceae bacterium]
MKNIGTVDRAVRIILGVALLSLLFILQNNLRYWGLVGLIPLVTGLLGYCPLYALLNIKTGE